MLGFNLQHTLTATMVLFAVIDIIGSVPLIISLEKKSGKIIPLKTTLVATVILIAFLFLGESILKIVGIDVNSFAVAGALVLFFIGLEMVLGVTFFQQNPDLGGKTASIVPLAFPVIAGAGSMTTLVSLRAEYETINIIIAVLVNMLFVFLVLKSTKFIEKRLGEGGIAVLEKIFGVILLSIAVKLFSSNISSIIANA